MPQIYFLGNPMPTQTNVTANLDINSYANSMTNSQNLYMSFAAAGSGPASPFVVSNAGLNLAP